MTSSIILLFDLNVEMRMYHNKAFPLGIIKANIKNYDLWLCNKLINCVNWSSGSFDSFEEDIWSQKEGLTFSQNIYFAPPSILYEGINIIELNKSMLRSGSYVLGAYNEYHIPRKRDYNSTNFNHDYILFGFDDNDCTFKSAAYLEDMSYSLFDIKYEHYLNGVIDNKIKKTYVNYYKIDNTFIPKIDIQFIRQNLENYLSSGRNLNCVSSKEVYGIDVWIELAKYVESAGNILDFRFGRACMEHHGLMLKRIQTLLKNQYIANETIKKEYADIYYKTKIVHNLFIKYNISKERELLKRIISLLKTVVDDERRVIKLLIDDIDAK